MADRTRNVSQTNPIPCAIAVADGTRRAIVAAMIAHGATSNGDGLSLQSASVSMAGLAVAAASAAIRSLADDGGTPSDMRADLQALAETILTLET